EAASGPGSGAKSRLGLVDEAARTSRFWLWIVADNLKFAAKNAVACALELNRLRPRGKVQ
ncbi:MAG: hypothetical protein ABI076_09810, partial [Acidobacteriaceae bacterium]